MWIQRVAGEAPQDLAFVALDCDGLPVNRLAGELRVRDRTIATLVKGRVRPLAPGHTEITMRIGDGHARTRVGVYERVSTFEGLRRDQRYVVAPVHLARGETIRWPLPQGLFWLQYRRTSGAQPIPTFAVGGPIMCLPDFGPTVERVSCLARAPGLGEHHAPRIGRAGDDRWLARSRARAVAGAASSSHPPASAVSGPGAASRGRA